MKKHVHWSQNRGEQKFARFEGKLCSLSLSLSKPELSGVGERVSLKSAQKCISYRKRLDQVEWVGDTREITFMDEDP